MLGVYTLFLLLVSSDVGFSRNTSRLSRHDFPQGFVFGAGTGAYQVEGAADEDGRSPSIWDTFTRAGKMMDKSTAHVASDQYHKYKDDVKLMSDMGLDAYRFSISWSRLLPNGTGAINPKGLEYYNNLINELISDGIQPHVTLHHWDLPQVLQDEYGGWLRPKIVVDFTAYAEVCFREFGDRVTHWTTINEPNIMSLFGYDFGVFPPCRCSQPVIFNCVEGDSSVEPYVVTHHALLAHASAAKVYREKYQAKQNGQIGLNLFSPWFTPSTNSTADIEAAQRALDFFNGWIIHPLVYGDYPKIMKENAWTRIPCFTESESEDVKGSFDFLGLNHYATWYVKDNPDARASSFRDFNIDMFAEFKVTADDPPRGQVLPLMLPNIPSGLENILEYVKNNYGNPPVYIHENGFATPSNEKLNDTARVVVLTGYMNAALSAIRKGSNTMGYFVWSFLDCFEYMAGYEARYGLYHVDFEDAARTRTPKLSAHWYSNFLNKGNEPSGAQTKGNGPPFMVALFCAISFFLSFSTML